MRYNQMIVIILAIIIGLSSVYFLGEDNPVEEVSEKIIQEETGINIDLTPNNLENKKD